jgi:hypothetical protein
VNNITGRVEGGIKLICHKNILRMCKKGIKIATRWHPTRGYFNQFFSFHSSEYGISVGQQKV